MKKIYLIFLLLLNGCFYHDGCFYTPQMVNCVDKGREYPAIAHYQKQTTIGKTDSQQRWKDVINCGAKYGDESLRSAMTKEKNGPIDSTLHTKFRACMKNLGYVRMQHCGYQSPKWDKGVCNL